MKRKSSVRMAILLIIVATVLCGCRDTLPPEVITTYSETMIITTTESFDSLVETFLSLRESISKLIKEDGTGTISLGMHRSDVLKVLDEHEIPYELLAGKLLPGDIRLGDSSYYGQDDGRTGSGTYYSFDFETGQLLSIDPMIQSFRGLKRGDPVQRIIELYGEPDEYYDGGDMGGSYRYLFTMGKDTVRFTVVVRGLDNNAKVYEMILDYRSAEEMTEQ